MRDWSRSKLGRPSSSNATTSPSSTIRREPSERASVAHLRVARGEVGAVAARAAPRGRGPSTAPSGSRPTSPRSRTAPRAAGAARCARASAEAASGIGSYAGSSGGSMRWIIQSLSRVLEQGVAAVHALAVEGRDHLVVAELLGLVGAAVPDGHRPGAVLALRDLAVELEVLERVVLGAHGEPVLVGVLRARRAAAPRRRACPRAPAAGPSGGGGRCAPGRRSGRRRPSSGARPSARASSRSRASTCRCRACPPRPLACRKRRVVERAAQLVDRDERPRPRRRRAAPPPRSRR